jgi:hypothetical protein
MQIGSNGIYRLYRLYPHDADRVDQRLVGVFAIIGGSIHHMEDHDDLLEEMLPEGKLNDAKFYRMMQLSDSPYWRLVHENDIESGEHPDLMPEANVGGDTWSAPTAPSVTVQSEEPAHDHAGKG